MDAGFGGATKLAFTMKSETPVYASISSDGSRYNVNFHHTVGEACGTQNACVQGNSAQTFSDHADRNTPLIDWRGADATAIVTAILRGKGPMDKGIRECAPDNPFCLLDLLVEAERIGGKVTTVGEYLDALEVDRITAQVALGELTRRGTWDL